MRPFAFLSMAIVLLAASFGPAPAGGQVETIRFVRVATHSPVILDGLGGAPQRADTFQKIGPFTSACVSFTNEDARTAKSIRVQFVFFDGKGDRADGSLLTRNGTFSTGVLERSADPNSVRFNREDCVPLHRPRTGFSAIVAYVDRVDFSDGTTWNAADVRFANHVQPGSPNVAYSLTDAGAAPNTSAVALAERAPGELAPLLLGTFANCSDALAGRQLPSTPLFDPSVIAALAPVHNVFVAAQRGAATGNLFNVGDVTVCSPSGDSAHDAVAITMVKQSHIVIREPQVFRIYFPVIDMSAGCTDGVRLLNRVLLDAAPAPTHAPPRLGEYLALVNVAVASDGRPTAAVVTRSAGPPQFDDSARQSALTSRFWPAIAAGKAVSGTFDFAMRWVVGPVEEPANMNGHPTTTTRTFGPAYAPAAAGCTAT